LEIAQGEHPMASVEAANASALVPKIKDGIPSDWNFWKRFRDVPPARWNPSPTDFFSRRRYGWH